MASIEDARRKHEAELMTLPNVVAVGTGERGGKKVVKVFVTHRVQESDLQPGEVVPKMLDGYPTDVEEIGVVTAQQQ
jgi:hypothetical protein